MPENNKYRNEKYIKISKDSGCISANYSIHNIDEDIVIVPYETNEVSGSFKLSRVDKSR